MKPYGMNKQEAQDLDAAGCRENGRKTSAYSVTKRAYRSLRKGKKKKIRRRLKKRARKDNKPKKEE